MKHFLAFFLFLTLTITAIAQVPQGTAMRATNGIGFGITTIANRLLATNTAGTNHFAGTLNVRSNIASQSIFYGDGSGLTNVGSTFEIDVRAVYGTNHDAVSAAITAGAAQKRTLYFSPGNFYVTNAIILPSDSSWRGVPDETFINVTCDPYTNYATVFAFSTVSAPATNLTFRGITFRSPATAWTNGVPYYFMFGGTTNDMTRNVLFDHCTFTSCIRAIAGIGGDYPVLDGMTVSHCLFYDIGGTNMGVRNESVENTVGISGPPQRNLVISDCSFDGIGYTEYDHDIYISRFSENVRITRCYSRDGIDLRGGRDMVVSECVFDVRSELAGTAGINVGTDSQTNMIIANNLFRGPNLAVKILGGVRGLVISGNDITTSNDYPVITTPGGSGGIEVLFVGNTVKNRFAGTAVSANWLDFTCQNSFETWHVSDNIFSGSFIGGYGVVISGGSGTSNNVFTLQGNTFINPNMTNTLARLVNVANTLTNALVFITDNQFIGGPGGISSSSLFIGPTSQRSNVWTAGNQFRDAGHENVANRYYGGSNFFTGVISGGSQMYAASNITAATDFFATSGDFIASATRFFYWNTRAGMNSPGSGRIRFTDSSFSSGAQLEAGNAILTNSLLTKAVFYSTNTFHITPNFTNEMQLASTNASFKFLQPVGVDTTKTQGQNLRVFVKNTGGSPITVTPPDGVSSLCQPWTVTNGTTAEFKFTVYAGEFTNVAGILWPAPL